MDINYTENKKNDFFDIFPLREENSAENDVLKNENDFSNDVFNKNATSENKNNFKSNSSNNFSPLLFSLRQVETRFKKLAKATA